MFGLQQSLPTISPNELNKTLGSKFSQRTSITPAINIGENTLDKAKSQDREFL
jgi:hypothetical protein